MTQLKKIKVPLVLAISTSLFVSGCSTVDPYTGEKQTAKATTGAAIGALSGAAIGAIAGNGKGALIGAASGAALGGGIGYYMDAQEAKLRKKLRSTGVSVTRNGDNITLNMPNDLTFGVDETHLSDRARQVLGGVALVLDEYDKTNVHVFGYTDSSGAEKYNQRLSEVRANTVSSYLLNNGVAANRVSSAGRGEGYPIASNATEEGRAQNRRVEIMLSPRMSN